MGLICLVEKLCKFPNFMFNFSFICLIFVLFCVFVLFLSCLYAQNLNFKVGF